MTEAEWLTCSDPERMLDYLRVNGLITDRKQRLFDCACVRRAWHLLTDERGRKALEVAERSADDMADLEQLREAQAIALAAADAQATSLLPGIPNSHIVLVAAAGAAWEYRSGADPLRHAAEAIAWEGLTHRTPSERRLARTRMAEERKVQAAYLRDIVGNPFRSVTVVSCDFTDAVTDLADSIYNDRAFDRLPALADALNMAGCTDAYLSAHCWLPGPHARACWVVDLLLGKE